MGQRGADDADRADQVGLDDPPDLFVGRLLDGREQGVARVVDDDVDLAEVGEGGIEHGAGRVGIGHVEPPHPQAIARGGGEVVERLRAPQGRRDAVTALEQLLGQQATETG